MDGFDYVAAVSVTLSFLSLMLRQRAARTVTTHVARNFAALGWRSAASRKKRSLMNRTHCMHLTKRQSSDRGKESEFETLAWVTTWQRWAGTSFGFWLCWRSGVVTDCQRGTLPLATRQTSAASRSSSQSTAESRSFNAPRGFT